MAQWYYGKEGQQYGPIDETALRAKIATGEIGKNDLIWSEGMVEWTPLNQISEFSASPSETAAVAPAEQYQSSNPSSPYAPPVANPVAPVIGGVQLAPPTSGLAIASMVCGILSIFFCFCGGMLLGIPAVICGHMAMKQTGSDVDGGPPRMGGRGMAIAGLVMGYIGIAILILGIIGNLSGFVMR
ncbi:GYF domain-containing protein [Akkermansiaceae bacterium]|nr:GYF domain-containing protein [Akkermansiaceae bacterium]MDB4544505.1 GYF domain-containing protein [Akkermansiaceae bacterium]